MKRFFGFLLIVIFLFGCINSPIEENEDEINVMVSFYPLYEFTTNIGGDKINVNLLIPPNIEPHEYELKPSDMVNIIESDLFVYNGGGMEPWVHNIIENNEVNVLDTSEGIELIKTELHEHEEEIHDNEVEIEEIHEHEHGEYDPHVWLSPKNAIKQVENIRDKLIEIDFENKEYYTNNAKEYIKKLEKLDEKIRNEINSEKCKKRDIVITHATLTYFCRDYGLEQIALSGINPQAEISVKQLTEIMEHIEGKNVSVIFTEEQINPQTAQVIAQELKIQTMTLNTIHGLSEEDKNAGKNYITLMEDNISKLKIALECEK